MRECIPVCMLMVRKSDCMLGILEPSGLMLFWDSYYNGKGEAAREAEKEMPQLVKDIAANVFGFGDARQNAVFALDLLLTPPKETEDYTRLVELDFRKAAASTKVMEALATVMLYQDIMRKPDGGVLGYEGEYRQFQRVHESTVKLLKVDIGRVKIWEMMTDRERLQEYLGDANRGFLLICYQNALFDYASRKGSRGWLQFERALLAEKFGERQFGELARTVGSFVDIGKKEHMSRLLGNLRKKIGQIEQMQIDTSKKMPEKKAELRNGGIANSRPCIH